MFMHSTDMVVGMAEAMGEAAFTALHAAVHFAEAAAFVAVQAVFMALQ